MRPVLTCPLSRLDHLLNAITMYRLVLYGLAILATISLGLAFAGLLGSSPAALLGSLVTLLAMCFITNRLLAILFDAAVGSESSLITALILWFVLAPPLRALELAPIALAGFLAMLTKYVLAYHRKHAFNPAAIAAVIIGASGLYSATWWVGTPILLPFTLVLGFLVVRKLRRFQMLGAFLFAAFTMLVVLGLEHYRAPLGVLATALASWPLIFFGTIMLTEPSTMPPRFRDQITLGLLVGALFAFPLRVGPISSTPELALVIGNLFAYLVSPKYRLRFQFQRQVKLSEHLAEYIFTPERPFTFRAGQYMDFILPHPHPDSRGNRRTFSLASSPTEPELRLGIRFAEPSSTFKATLCALQPGAIMMGGQLAGEFTLPTDPSRKLLGIAGGIGITPFRSMLKFLTDTHQQRDLVLLYLVRDPAELVYRDVLQAAAADGVKVIPVLDAGTATTSPVPASWDGLTGPLTSSAIQQAVPDARLRRSYISGPNAMVDHYRHLLRQLGVPRRHIITDYFAGY